MELYLHFRICNHGVCENNFIFIVVSFSVLFRCVFWLRYHAFSTAHVTSNGRMAVNEQGYKEGVITTPLDSSVCSHCFVRVNS